MHFAPIRPDVAAQLARVDQKMLSVAIGSADPQSPVCQAVIHHLRTPGLRVRSQIALHAADCLAVDAQSALAREICLYTTEEYEVYREAPVMAEVDDE